ncbi:MAG: YSC84-related protein [Planctomycetota bacterium]
MFPSVPPRCRPVAPVVAPVLPLVVCSAMALAIVALPAAGQQPFPTAAPVAAQPAVFGQAPVAFGQQEVETVVGARNALDQFSGLAIESIPPAMLTAAEGVAIFPNMIKGGFIFGVNYGRGVLLVRRPDRTWSAPVMVTMGGGSVGFQAGVQAADIVLVFATPRSLQGMLAGQKVTLGADASIAAGPVGRTANAGTDARLGAEIYSYARSRGLFLGVSLGGSDLSVDNNANAQLYGRFGVTTADVFNGNGIALRPEVQQLIADLNVRSHAVPAVPAATPGVAPTPVGTPAPVTAAPGPVAPQPAAAVVPIAPAPTLSPPVAPPVVPINR